MRLVIRALRAAVLILTAEVVFASICTADVTAAPRVDFNRDVRPILADRCFRCHGPDGAARKRGLRLDTQEGSRAVLRGGGFPIVPHDIEASEVARRISSDEPEEVMPPPSLNLPLSLSERDILTRWIAEGGDYQPRWAFVAPEHTAPPPSATDSWCRDQIDTFVLDRLKAAGLQPALEVERATLLRRAALTLNGIQPTIEETNAFVADTAPDAGEQQIDRLLASPRFGERMAPDWLDVARFADTFGYQSDWECHTWPWRDWVIAAFNANKPWDVFVTKQLAGDLLPGATQDNRLATAFNRLHRQTHEGGSIDEELRQEDIADRVQTFSAAFLGLTVECARCHDHKYDPIPQRDYYSLGAFFGAIDESGTYPYTTRTAPRPALRLPNAPQREALVQLAAAVESANTSFTETLSARRDALDLLRTDVPDPEIPPPIAAFPLDGAIDGPDAIGGSRATLFDGDTGITLLGVPSYRRCDPFSAMLWIKSPSAIERAVIVHTSQFTIESDQQGWQILLKDGRLCWEIVHNWPGSAAAIRTSAAIPVDRWVHIAVTSDGSSLARGMSISIDGVRVETEIERDHLDGPANVRALQVGARDRDIGFKGGAVDELRIFDRELTALEIVKLNDVQPNHRLLDDDDARRFWAINTDPECRAAFTALRTA